MTGFVNAPQSGALVTSKFFMLLQRLRPRPRPSLRDGASRESACAIESIRHRLLQRISFSAYTNAIFNTAERIGRLELSSYPGYLALNIDLVYFGKLHRSIVIDELPRQDRWNFFHSIRSQSS